MKQFLFFLSCIGLSALYSCQSRVCSAIPEAMDLVADSIKIEHEVYAPNKMFVLGDKVVVYERGAKKYFSVFELPSFTFLYSCGEKGHSANELLSIDNSFCASDNGFKLFEIGTNKVKEVVLHEQNATVEDVCKIKASTIGINRFTFLKDNAFVYLSDNDDYEYCLLSADGKESYFGEYPEGMLAENDSRTPRYIAYNKHTAGKPDGSKFAAFYAYIRMCRIYDDKGNLLHETLLAYPQNTIDGKNVIEYPESPYVTDEYLYMLHRTNGADELEVWNWDGELLSLYQLDRKLKTITVSDNTLYGLNMERPNIVYKYDIGTKIK